MDMKQSSSHSSIYLYLRFLQNILIFFWSSLFPLFPSLQYRNNKKYYYPSLFYHLSFPHYHYYHRCYGGFLSFSFHSNIKRYKIPGITISIILLIFSSSLSFLPFSLQVAGPGQVSLFPTYIPNNRTPRHLLMASWRGQVEVQDRWAGLLLLLLRPETGKR